MMSHCESSVMLFADMDPHHEQECVEGHYSISGLGSLPKDVSQGLDLSLFESINNDETCFDLFNDVVEEGRNGSGVGVDESEAAGQDDVIHSVLESEATGQDDVIHSVLNWALGSIKHDLDHDYDGKSDRVNELIDSSPENDVDESLSRSGSVSSPRLVRPQSESLSRSGGVSSPRLVRPQRPKRAATLKKRAVSICSDSSSEMSPKGRDPSGERSMSKNAIAARENREKKKQYVSNLERRNKVLEETTKRMRSEIETHRKKEEAMTNEIRYLRGCLANAPEISAVMKSVTQIPGWKQVSTSLSVSSKSQERKRWLRSNDEENASPPKSRRLHPLTGTDKTGLCLTGTEKTGVCVHVSDGAVSLEFCSQCSKSAKIASKR